MTFKPHSRSLTAQTMDRPWTELHVLSEDESAAAGQRTAAEAVLCYFENHYCISPAPRVVCIFDSQDGWDLKRELGQENRGLHCPPRGHIYRCLPFYVQPIIGPINPRTGKVEWPFEMVIYLHGSTCETEIGLSMCLAHELQHFIQYAQRRALWALNTLLVELRSSEFRFWWDFPAEQDARIVSKQVGTELFGEKAVDLYIRERIEARITETDAQDWEFVRSIDPSIPYDLSATTIQLVEKHRAGLLGIFENFREEPAFAGLDLERLLRGEDAP